MATFYHSGSQPVPIGCYSIFVLQEAVRHKFPMDPDEFGRRFQVQRLQEGLFMLIALTEDAVVNLSRRLAMAGFFVGSEFAITGPTQGPIQECPGVVFWDCGRPAGNMWRVNVKRQRQWSSTALYGSMPALDPVVIDRFGRLLHSQSVSDDDGVVLAHRQSREGGRLHDEYLCVFRGTWGFELNVHRYRWLGDIPDDWFDDEDELLPEHRDHNDRIILPASWGGQQVFGEAHGTFVGTLEAIPAMVGVQVSDASECLVRSALDALGWHERSLSVVLRGLAMLVDAVPGEREPQVPKMSEEVCQPTEDRQLDPAPWPPKAPDPNWQRRVPPRGGLVTWAYLGDEDEEA